MMRVLITGATGFVGGALARRLHTMGNWDVTATGRNPLKGEALVRDGIRFAPADLADEAAVHRLCADQDLVFHCGALAAPWGKPDEFDRANVQGTTHIVGGCAAANVRRLVYVSTPSIYFHGDSREAVKEHDPLPTQHINDYVRTKKIAERVVNEAGIPAITIRPRAIIGPGDPTILPRIIERLAKGRLPIIGDGTNRADLTDIENVVDALLLCASAPEIYVGNTYNITNGEPLILWDAIQHLAQRLGYPPPTYRLPKPMVFALAGAIENAYRWLNITSEPPLTRYSVGVLTQTQTLDISAARRDLGYQPRVSNDEAFERYITWWQSQR